jgi:hypothetical protein
MNHFLKTKFVTGDQDIIIFLLANIVPEIKTKKKLKVKVKTINKSHINDYHMNTKYLFIRIIAICQL